MRMAMGRTITVRKRQSSELAWSTYALKQLKIKTFASSAYVTTQSATMSSTLEKLLREKTIHVHGNGPYNQKQRDKIFKTKGIFRARAEHMRAAASAEARAIIAVECAEELAAECAAKRAATRALQSQIDIFAAFDEQARQQRHHLKQIQNDKEWHEHTDRVCQLSEQTQQMSITQAPISTLLMTHTSPDGGSVNSIPLAQEAHKIDTI